jgi:hypothetical protein
LHRKVDIAHWSRQFPLADFEKQEGPRQFKTTKPGDPLDLWKARGRIISSPVDLAVTEQVRERAVKLKKLGPAVLVDLFLWAVGAPEHPYLTKIGGVPHRSKAKPWPKSKAGKPMTFVAQICFLDSKDIVSKALPGDVMLMFFKNADSHFGKPGDVHIEWSSRELADPVAKKDCPVPAFPVPELAAVIYRTREYPEGLEAFEELGHDQPWLFATTQSTKIGQATWFIQHDPRRKGEELLCTFNSLQPAERWPFTNRESLTASEKSGGMHGRTHFTIMFGDVGCMYFLIDRSGKVRWQSDCY